MSTIMHLGFRFADCLRAREMIMHIEFTIYPKGNNPHNWTVGWYAYADRTKQQTIGGSPQTALAEFRKIIEGTTNEKQFLQEYNALIGESQAVFPRTSNIHDDWVDNIKS